MHRLKRCFSCCIAHAQVALLNHLLGRLFDAMSHAFKVNLALSRSAFVGSARQTRLVSSKLLWGAQTRTQLFQVMVSALGFFARLFAPAKRCNEKKSKARITTTPLPLVDQPEGRAEAAVIMLVLGKPNGRFGRLCAVELVANGTALVASDTRLQNEGHVSAINCMERGKANGTSSRMSRTMRSFSVRQR